MLTVKRSLRLLLEALDAAVVVGVDHAVLDVDVALLDGHRGDRASLAIAASEQSEVQRGEDVAVERQERVLGALDVGQRAGGAERLVLVDELDRDRVAALWATQPSIRPLRWPTEIVIPSTPALTSWCRRTSRIGRSPSGMSGLGSTVV